VSAPNLDISHAGLNDGGGGGGTWSGTSTLNRVLTLGGGGTYAFGGSITGTNRSLTVALTGSGSQTLSGNNNYSGTTTVNSGTLRVDGSIGSGAVNVNGGALGGTGSIGGAVTVGAATLAPGGSPGTLSIASLTLSGSSTTLIELGGATPGDGSTFYDQVDVTGNATLAGTLTVTNFGGFDFAGGPYYILARGSGSGAFAGLPEGATVLINGSYPGTITYNANWLGSQGASTLTGGNDVAIFNVIPEPASMSILALAGLAMLGRRSRR
jgi:autotransporter-associated beta strand protein